MQRGEDKGGVGWAACGQSRGPGFNPLAAQPLLYPHRVLMILVTSLEPSLLNASGIDFKTRKADECLSEFTVPQLPAHDLCRFGSPTSLAPAFRQWGRSLLILVAEDTLRTRTTVDGRSSEAPGLLPRRSCEEWEWTGLMHFF